MENPDEDNQLRGLAWSQSRIPILRSPKAGLIHSGEDWCLKNLHPFRIRHILNEDILLTYY